MSSDFSDNESDQGEEQLKILLLGDSATGKTSIALRYCYNEFGKQYFPTNGVDFFLKQALLPSKRVSLKIWDVSGTHKTTSTLEKYVYGAHIIFFVYDLTNEETFLSLPYWLGVVHQLTRGQAVQPVKVLLGNKNDLDFQKTVKIEKHQSLANDFHLASYIVSARNGEYISYAFQKSLAAYLGVKLTKSEIEEHQPIMRAEISTHSKVPLQSVQSTFHTSRSSVCSLQ